MTKAEIEGRGAGLRRRQPWFWLVSGYDYGYGYGTSIITFIAVDEQPDCYYFLCNRSYLLCCCCQLLLPRPCRVTDANVDKGSNIIFASCGKRESTAPLSP